jgi:hypothetical protein
VVHGVEHCSTSQKVASSIRGGVIGIFHWINPADRTLTLLSTQPIIEMSTRRISWEVKAAVHLHVLIFQKFWEFKSPGALRTCLGLYRDSFTSLPDWMHNHIHNNLIFIIDYTSATVYAVLNGRSLRVFLTIIRNDINCFYDIFKISVADKNFNLKCTFEWVLLSCSFYSI